MTGHLRGGLSRQAPFKRSGREEGIKDGRSGYGVQVMEIGRTYLQVLKE